MSKTVIFRCDSSSEIGLGHLSRCIAIAKEIKKDNNVIFATIPDKTNTIIKNEDFGIFLKESETEEDFLLRSVNEIKPNIMVLDKKYSYKKDIIQQLKNFGVKIIIMDHICDGISEADEVIFPNAHLDKKLLNNYLSKKQIENVKSGPEYVIIRDEILDLKREKLKSIKSIHDPPVVVITTGGSDPRGVLIKILPWLMEGNFNAEFRVLIGESFQQRDKLESIIHDMPNNFRILDYSPREFINADIVICTFGVTVYEMIYLQIPTICIAHTIQNDYACRILHKKIPLIKNIFLRLVNLTAFKNFILVEWV